MVILLFSPKIDWNNLVAESLGKSIIFLNDEWLVVKFIGRIPVLKALNFIYVQFNSKNRFRVSSGTESELRSLNLRIWSLESKLRIPNFWLYFKVLKVKASSLNIQDLEKITQYGQYDCKIFSDYNESQGK